MFNNRLNSLLDGSLPMVLLGLLALACLFELFRGLFAPRATPREASCGQCGQVTVFGSPTCAECGCDLRQVGTLTRRSAMRVRSNLLLLLAAWTVLMVLGWTAADSGLTAARGQTAPARVPQITFSQTFQPMRDRSIDRTTRQPRSSLPEYTLVLSGMLTDDTWDSCQLNVTTPDGPGVQMSVNPDQKSWTIRGDGDPISGQAFDASVIKQLYGAALIDVSSPGVQSEIDQIADVLANLSTQGYQATAGSNWGINNRSTLRPEPPTEAPNLTMLDRDRTSRKDTQANVQYVLGRSTEASSVGVDVEVHFTASSPDQKPEKLTALSITLRTPIGWPIALPSDPWDKTWSASRGETPWAGGMLPMTESDATALLDRIAREDGDELPAGLASDLAALMNMGDDDLVGFTQWTSSPMRPRTRATSGLRTMGGSRNTTTLSIQPESRINWPLTAICTAFALAWLIGMIFIAKRRARLIAG